MGLIIIGIVIYVVWQKIGKMKVQPSANNGADRNARYTNAGYEHTSGQGGISTEGTVHRSTAGSPTIVGHSMSATYNLSPISNAHTFS
ncbi:hypothetical protein DPMN_152870 [Dreissena polymorpha]|uniref:Uncharacterized protein n=1 Tax=Dreissena polymorpha TaxID=45954 RepID=A0A9D4J7R0_DREPO|nr:hypothetical protein DPMN_152870 [Dreissena polymorpha]